MWSNLAAWLKTCFEFAKSEPFGSGLIIGLIISAFVASAMAKIQGLGGYKDLTDKWQAKDKASQREIKTIKKEMKDKDRRLRLCHNDLDKSREQLRTCKDHSDQLKKELAEQKPQA